MIILSSVAHLALKAEDGDAQKHGGSDANAQHHRFGVVETVGKMIIVVSRYYCKHILWNLEKQVCKHSNT